MDNKENQQRFRLLQRGMRLNYQHHWYKIFKVLGAFWFRKKFYSLILGVGQVE